MQIRGDMATRTCQFMSRADPGWTHNSDQCLSQNKGFSHHGTLITASIAQAQERKTPLKSDTIQGVPHLPAKRVTSHTLHNHELQTLSRWSMASLRS